MGSLQSSVSKEVAAAYTKVVNTVVNNVVDKSNLNCTGENIFEFSTGVVPGFRNFPPQTCPFSFTSGNITIGQTNAETCNLSSTNITTISTTIKNNIQTFVIV